MKNPKKTKGNDVWNEVNNLTKHVTGNKISKLQNKKRFFISFFAFFSSLILAASTFLIAITIQNAFNMINFKPNLSIDEQIVIDMDKVDIHVSNKSLRLAYLEKETIDQVFQIISQDWWWETFMSTAKNKYDFIFYSENGTEGLDKNLIQADGLAKFHLIVKLKNSLISFKLPIIAQIINNSKFYEKFMMFNHYEGHYSRHISGVTNVSTFPYKLQEKRYKGYLPYSIYFSNNISNIDIYNIIERQLKNFITDYSEEFTANTHIFPILSTINLGDLNINITKSFDPYIKLITHPELFYIGKAAIGSVNQYVNLQNYTWIPNVPTQTPRPFYISYFSDYNVVNDLIALKPTTSQQVIDYFTVHRLDYLPFSNLQKGENDYDQEIPYTPAHKIFSIYNSAINNFKYSELVNYFALSYSISHNIEKLKVSQYANIGTLMTVLANKYWQNMFQCLLAHKNYFYLHYPNISKPADDNWQTIVARGVTSFKWYFMQALQVNIDQLATFTFLDKNHYIIPLSASDLINPSLITNFRFDLGQNLKNNPNYNSFPISFSFFFKVNWI